MLLDLSIVGWDASPETVSAVVNLIDSRRDALSLSTDDDCFNGLGVNDVISYFEHNPLLFFVLYGILEFFLRLGNSARDFFGISFLVQGVVLGFGSKP